MAVSHADRQATALAGRPIAFGPPKRPASYHDIPIPRDAVEALSAHIAEFSTGDHGADLPRLGWRLHASVDVQHLEASAEGRRSGVWGGAAHAEALLHLSVDPLPGVDQDGAEAPRPFVGEGDWWDAGAPLHQAGRLWATLADADERTREAVAGMFGGPVATDVRQTGVAK